MIQISLEKFMNHSLLKRIIFEQHDVIKKSKIVDRDIAFEKKGNYVVTGLRRAGKSTLLYKRVKDLVDEGKEWKQIIYINFDDERLFGFTLNDFDDIREDIAFKRETSALVKYAKNGHPDAKLVIVTYEEEQTLEIDGYHIDVIPLWKFLLGGI